MDNLYIQLRGLVNAVQGIRHIDEDTGQLEAMLNGEDTYPIVFPAILIGFEDMQWSSVKGINVQRGTGHFLVRTAFDCYDDTYEGAGQDAYATARHETVGTVHSAIQGQLNPETNTPFIRVRSRSYALPGRIKVYEAEYSYTTEE